MRQILQYLKTGKREIANVPCPQVKAGHFLVQTRVSLISAGTERMLVEFGKAGYLSKARSQPDKVKQVLDKIRTDGLLRTLDVVWAKLDQPLLLGYCNVGIVQELGNSGIEGLKIGDRVVNNGPHAEVVCVSKNLCAQVPDEVSDEEGAFTVVGAIGLQGIRLAQPSLGEAFVVTGLGLIGQLTVQLLIAHGCRVLGIDFESAKCDLARRFGAETVNLSNSEDPIEAAVAFSRGLGVDGVLITAASKSSQPVHQAAEMCRKRGRIILVGQAGLELRRPDFYEKELSFQVSCSYGPGRYDAEYEQKGHDYPVGFVRWTAQRNFEAVLDSMASGKVDVKSLISHRFPFEEAEKSYELILENKEPYLGIILEYNSGLQGSGDPGIQKDERTVILKQSYKPTAMGQLPIVGLIGAGNFTGQVLLPALKKTGVRLKMIASSGGVSGTLLGKKFGFEENTTEVKRICDDPDINTVFITTRHDTHASFVLETFKAGKNVFVEKPLCLNQDELSQIEKTYNDSQITNDLKLMVGFNRRFSPHVIKMKELLDTVKEPKSMVMTINAGAIPTDHWTQDPELGGGRIIGEACHFIDLLRFLAGSKTKSSEIARLKSGVGDTVSIQLAFSDGSIGTIHYFANGNRRFPKERLEVFSGGRILQLDNFKNLKGYGWKNFKKMKLWRQDKGHRAEIGAFLEAVQSSGPSPIHFDEIIEATKTTIELASILND